MCTHLEVWNVCCFGVVTNLSPESRGTHAQVRWLKHWEMMLERNGVDTIKLSGSLKEGISLVCLATGSIDMVILHQTSFSFPTSCVHYSGNHVAKIKTTVILAGAHCTIDSRSNVSLTNILFKQTWQRKSSLDLLPLWY